MPSIAASLKATPEAGRSLVSRSLTSRPPQAPTGVKGILQWTPPALAVAGTLLAWSGSLVPSLLPRPWLLQGIISAVAISVGYLVGLLAARVIVPVTRRVHPSVARRTAIGIVVCTAAVLVGSLALHYVWRSDVNRVMGMEGSVAAYLLAAFVVGGSLGYLMLIALRVAHRLWLAAVRRLTRWMPLGVAKSLVLGALLVSAVFVFDVLVFGRLAGALSDAYLHATLSYDDDVSRPSLSTQAGGPGSLISWDGIGLQGREFVASARTRAELERFSGRPGRDPIRVYVGIGSAETVSDRARLAVDELERAGGFDRAALVMITPTGTGWVDPYAIDPLEFIFNGDTAAIAVQYSHLPSWVMLLGNQDLAIDSSWALFEEVTQRMTEIDEDERPRLFLYGESLGSFAQEAIFTDLDEVREQTDGALWVGPSRTNRLWQKLMAERSEDSPIWRPVVGDGMAVRFGPDGETLASVEGPWKTPRVAYLQHASDPITWLSTDLILQRPEWLDPPRGLDVSKWMPYVPGVTFLQVLVDLVMGTNAPIGHGHKFGAAQTEAWALITTPEAWSAADTQRLRSLIENDLGNPK
ncbi:MAG TPA: alpha/beta-hydrolase family protein [Acidimicrobiia bacterium]